jgi:succinate-semialdehyde dehydrogenase/glutarate-semialdehyde dehydrogenase
MTTRSDAFPPGLDTDRLASLAHCVVAEGERDQIAVEAPFDGGHIGSVPACTADDVDSAVDLARAAQAEWAAHSVADRAAVFSRFHDLVLEHRDDLLDLIQLESGKARVDALEELLDVSTNARHYASRAESYLASTRRDGAMPLLTHTVEHRHPIGVVGVVAPWNYPLTLAISDAIPALLAGNTVVVKPAEETPYSTFLVRELLLEAGLPRGVFEVVTGDGETTGAALVERVDYVCFTGSTEAGRDVARRAGENLVDCSLELGGKNPMVVLADADPEAAANGAVRGSFANAGQLCLSMERLYVHDAVYDEFVDEFVARTRRLTLGTGYDWDTDVGSLVSEAQLSRVEAHVEDALEKGANLLVGGRHRPDVAPYAFEPTILTGVTEEMSLATEETFGPVVALYRVDSEAEAVERANDSAYGLNASVWTEDGEYGREVARELECGTVNVNDAYAAAWASVDAPMGGMKDSGLGRRHGRQGFLRYTEAQTVAEQRVGSLQRPESLPTEWYATLMTWTMRAMAWASRLRR